MCVLLYTHNIIIIIIHEERARVYKTSSLTQKLDETAGRAGGGGQVRGSAAAAKD